jgi:broad specificity phosphatase PhoE
MSVVLLIRHGQASVGWDDYDRLSPRGLEQAGVLGAALRERALKVGAVVCGRQLRHAQTAEACLTELGAKHEIRRLAGFDELDHLELLGGLDPRYADRAALVADVMASGDPLRAAQEIFARAVARWVGGEHDADYSETWSSFRRRCGQALEEVTQLLSHDETALVFTSGGPITAICQELLGLADEHAFRITWTLVNCGVTKVLTTRRGLQLSTVNEHAHFEGRHRSLISYR